MKVVDVDKSEDIDSKRSATNEKTRMVDEGAKRNRYSKSITGGSTRIKK